MKTLLILLSVVTSAYYNRAFHTEKAVVVDASQDSVNIVLDRFCYELQTNPDLLFEWVFKGTGTQGDATKDALQLIYKETGYEPEDRHGLLVVDVATNGKVRYKNILLETWSRDSIDTALDSVQSEILHLDMMVSAALIDSAYMNFHVTPITEQRTEIAFDFHIRFGWFFNIFITKKVYREVIEWRLDAFMENLRRFINTGDPLPPEED